MASNGAAAQMPYGPVLAALATMSANADRAQKTQAHEFLEKFQKSSEAWQSTHAMLQSADATVEGKLFAATTLKGKITYDLDQLPRQALPALRDSLLSLLSAFRSGPRPIRTQLCICLASLAIQMLEWQNVLSDVISSLGADAESGPCVLDFLRILPEEVTEGRKITLSEDDLRARTKQLLEDNAPQVLQLLIQFSQHQASMNSTSYLLECISSWLREIPVASVVSSPLLAVIIEAVKSEESFDAAVDCLCTIFRETREVDEYHATIQILYPRIVALRPKIAQAATSEDLDVYKGITRLFAEAGEAWIVLIARSPKQFRELVESVLECAARDRDRDAVALTFNFWNEMKLYITLEKYVEARAEFAHEFSQLVDIMIKHLEFPVPEGGDETDLFDGDREQEEKFREFRHAMGDVLKQCCEVLGVTECLGKTYKLIESWVGAYGRLATDTEVPHWQGLEAPLFGMRAMGRMVSPEENIILPRLMPLLVQVPSHEKIRFAAIMALGRYTEWTAEHPQFLEPQLQFIIKAFSNPSKEVVRAAALAFKFFCQDCKTLLKDHVVQLHTFYNATLDQLPQPSQEELTEGVAHVVSVQPLDKIYEMLKLYCDPLLDRLKAKAERANDQPSKLDVADHLQLLTLFISLVAPYAPPQSPNPAVSYMQTVFPILAVIIDTFISFPPICERVCRCWRTMIFSYRTAMKPLLAPLAEKLASCFAASKQGCFLWTTDAIIREFSEGQEFVDAETSRSIYGFFEGQAISMLRALNDVTPEELPDVIEDFFRLLSSALLYHPLLFIPSPLFSPILSSALTALSTLQQVDPLTSTLHFLRDVLAYGHSSPPSSSHLRDPSAPAAQNPPHIIAAVTTTVHAEGPQLVQRLLTGMMFSFPRDCFPDASGVLLAVVELYPQEVGTWIGRTVGMLPAGTVSQLEMERLMGGIEERLRNGEQRKVRYLLQDFTNQYRRRNVAPREGLGRLEVSRFRFSG